jgi:hypothetical protein
MEKTKKLLLILEGLALIVATILILVDYKLKNDLVDLYRKMEGTLERGKEFYSEVDNSLDHLGRVRPSTLVRDGTTLETATANHASNGNGKTASSRATSAKRNGRIGNTPLPESDHGVGS